MSVLLRRYYQLLAHGNWLRPTTKTAILGAFGNAALAVIKATNAYLNDLARTDKTKATALAEFINEDPMLICSLDLQPQGVVMPIRLIYGNGAYFDTLLKAGPNTKTSAIFHKLSNAGNNSPIFGARHNTSQTGPTMYYYYFYGISRFALGSNGYVASSTLVPSVGLNKVSIEPNKAIFNNSEISIGNLTTPTSYSMYIMGVSMGGALWDHMDNGYGLCNCKVIQPYLESDCEFVPCKNISGSNYGFLELNSLQWRAASNNNPTIAYTLPNGQLWTPGTPLP